MVNDEEYQIKEAIEAIHLPDDIAARTLASIEAKRKQQENERTAGALGRARRHPRKQTRGAKRQGHRRILGFASKPP